jgi:hypothetical protein
MKFKWMIHTYFENMRLFFCTVSVIFNTLLSMLSKTLYTKVIKSPALTSKHVTKNLVSICHHLQNGVHVMHTLQDQTGGSQREPNLGCEQDGKEQTIKFLQLFTCAHAGMKLGVAMREEDLFWLGQTL